jgi:hypothetical protein
MLFYVAESSMNSEHAHGCKNSENGVQLRLLAPTRTEYNRCVRYDSYAVIFPSTSGSTIQRRNFTFARGSIQISLSKVPIHGNNASNPALEVPQRFTNGIQINGSIEIGGMRRTHGRPATTWKKPYTVIHVFTAFPKSNLPRKGGAHTSPDPTGGLYGGKGIGLVSDRHHRHTTRYRPLA